MMQRPQMQPPPGGSLGDALENLQKYVQNESFSNQKGQTQEFGPLQFDTKGVEFGPWIRRFISQVRRNWFVPMAAMTMRGRVVITFFVHRNGALDGRHGDSSLGDRVVQYRGRERAAGLEPDHAAAARVSGRQGVFHGHVLLQRVASRSMTTAVPRVHRVREVP